MPYKLFATLSPTDQKDVVNQFERFLSENNLNPYYRVILKDNALMIAVNTASNLNTKNIPLHSFRSFIRELTLMLAIKTDVVEGIINITKIDLEALDRYEMSLYGQISKEWDEESLLQRLLDIHNIHKLNENYSVRKEKGEYFLLENNSGPAQIIKLSALLSALEREEIIQFQPADSIQGFKITILDPKKMHDRLEVLEKEAHKEEALQIQRNEQTKYIENQLLIHSKMNIQKILSDDNSMSNPLNAHKYPSWKELVWLEKLDACKNLKEIQDWANQAPDQNLLSNNARVIVDVIKDSPTFYILREKLQKKSLLPSSEEPLPSGGFMKY